MDNPRTKEEIEKENAIFGEKMNAFLLNQLALIEKKSERAEHVSELVGLSKAAAELIKCFRDEWMYLALPSQTDRVLTKKGLYIRKDSYPE